MPDHLAPELSEDARRLFDACPAGVCYGVDERIAYVNPAFCQLLGMQAEQLIGRPMFDIYPPDWRARAAEYYRARQRDPKAVPAVFEVEFVRSDGTRQRAEVEPRALPSSRPGTREAILFARDTSKRSRSTALVETLSEVALAVQRARTQAEAMHSATSGIRALGLSCGFARFDGSGHYVVEELQANERASLLLGKILGGTEFVGRRFAYPTGGLVARAFHERTVVFTDDFRPTLLKLAARCNPAADQEQLLRDCTNGDLARAVICPLYSEGRPWGFLGIASDALTSADAAGIGLFAAQLGMALETAGMIADLEHKNRELAAIQAVARAGAEHDLEQLLPTLCGIAASATSSDSTAIFLIDHEHQLLRLAAAHGGPPNMREKFSAIPLSGPLEVSHMFELQAFAVDRLPEPVRGPVQAAGFRHMAMIPLHIKGRLAGTVSLTRRGDRRFTAEELASAERLCSQIAIQLESARLYGEANRRMRQLSVLFDLSRIGTESLETTALANRVLATISETLAFQGGALHLLEGNELMLIGESGVAHQVDLRILPCDEKTLTGQAALRRRTVLADRSCWPEKSRFRNFPEVRRALAIPLLSSERLIGVLSLSRDEDRPFDPEELRLLESCAAQVAISIEHARLFEEERRRVQQLKLFLEVGRMVTGSLDLAPILEASAEAVAKVTEASNCYIFLLDPSRRYLVGTAASDPAEREAFRRVRLPLTETQVAANVVKARTPARLPDVKLPTEGPQGWGVHFGHLSVLALPLLARDEAIGVVIVGDRHRRREWPDAEVERASVLVGQFAVAVSNARLYEDLKHSYQKLAHAQEELVRRERLAALGELSAVVAHEVRNPLGVIFNSLGSLRRVLRPSGDTAMLLDIVAEEADRLNRIVGDLLDFARPHDPTLHPEPLATLVEQAVQGTAALASANRVTVQTRAEDGLPAVPADARMLRQAIVNLVVNAIQAMPRGGAVTVAVRRDGDGDSSNARIEVSDTGPGVPPDLVDRVFQPFFTTKASGTGLGLAVVKRIIEAHRGEIGLESKPGEGARFVIRLPMERAAG